MNESRVKSRELLLGGLAAVLALLLWALLASDAAGQPQAPEARELAAKHAAGCCRWELVHASARHDGPGTGSLRPATLLLDQCSGRTWLLVHSPRGGLEWRPVGRDLYGVVLE